MDCMEVFLPTPSYHACLKAGVGPISDYRSRKRREAELLAFFLEVGIKRARCYLVHSRAKPACLWAAKKRGGEVSPHQLAYIED